MTDIAGFVGLGIMGRPMAINLRRAGFAVNCHARRAPMMEPLVAEGAVACDSPAAVAGQSDVIFTMVSDSPDVEQVILGKGGIIEQVRPGSVVVDMSTISPSVTRHIADRLREQGVEMLDAPVSGGDIGAINGTLSIMVGGQAEAFERVRPMFEAMGSNIVHVGDNGAGQVAKGCNQVVISQTIAAVGEAFLLASRSGVDPARVREALLGGFAGSKVLEIHGQRILDGNFEPGFKLELLQKDLHIDLQTARELGIDLSGTARAAQLVNALCGRGDGGLDASLIGQFIDDQSSTPRRSD